MLAKRKAWYILMHIRLFLVMTQEINIHKASNSIYKTFINILIVCMNYYDYILENITLSNTNMLFLNQYCSGHERVKRPAGKTSLSSSEDWTYYVFCLRHCRKTNHNITVRIKIAGNKLEQFLPLEPHIMSYQNIIFISQLPRNPH